MVRQILTLSAIFLPVALIACGGDGGGNGGSGGGTSSSSSSSSSTSTSSSSSSTSTSSSSSSTSTSSSSSGSAAGSCTDAPDMNIITTQDVASVAGDCAKTNIATQDKIQQCIVDGTAMGGNPGLTQECAGCFAGAVKCAISKCLNECLADSSSDACTCCRIMNCDDAFVTCSGLPHEMPPAAGCN